jgi:hypothetical protein
MLIRYFFFYTGAVGKIDGVVAIQVIDFDGV